MLVIWGNGGHAKSIVSANRNRHRVEYYVGDSLGGLSKFEWSSSILIFGFGDLRARMRYLSNGAGAYPFATITHDTSFTAGGDTHIGVGSFLSAGAVVNSGAKVGRHCIVNTNAVVEHDCEVGDCSHVAPGAVLLGGVKVGKGVLVGANATVLPRVTIGDGLVIPAGAVVRRDVTVDNVESL